MRKHAAMVWASVLIGVALAGFGLPEQVRAESDSATTESVPYYTVRTVFDGQPEFLFEIAERFLGNGDRFTEIFVLNEGRPQADGSALTDPAVLKAGWVLELPPDASGDGIENGPLPELATPNGTSAQPSSETGVPAVVWIIAVVLVAAAGAAGGYLVLKRRRRTAVAAPVERVIGGDRSGAWTVDSALRIVTAACDRDHIPFPGLYLVTIDATSIHVLLSSPSANAPGGWLPSADGRTWSASLARLQLERVPGESGNRFPGLATLGTTPDGRVLLDFQNARGLVSVGGSASAVSDVVEGWLSELRNNPWSRSTNILRLGAKATGSQESIDSFLTREDRSNDGVAVLDAPSRAQGEALRRLFSVPDFRWILIVQEKFDGASWRFVARDGLLTSEFLPDIRYASAPHA